MLGSPASFDESRIIVDTGRLPMCPYKLTCKSRKFVKLENCSSVVCCRHIRHPQFELSLPGNSRLARIVQYKTIRNIPRRHH